MLCIDTTPQGGAMLEGKNLWRQRLLFKASRLPRRAHRPRRHFANAGIPPTQAFRQSGHAAQVNARGSFRSIGQKEDAVKADRVKVEKLLKTAKGQLDGILRMVEEDRYCIDISNQILAAQAVLNRANKEILKAHMEMCVNRAVETGDSQQKMAELYSVLDKILK